MFHNMIWQGESQKGISLVVTFLIMTIILAIVLSISVILFSEVKIISNIGNSVVAIYLAESGAEKTLFFDRKQIPPSASRGFCSICSFCEATECSACIALSLASDGSNGCDENCQNCSVQFDSYINGNRFAINGKITPDSQDPAISVFEIDAKGFYKGTARSIEAISTNQ